MKESPDLHAFVRDVVDALTRGERYAIAGFGTFTTCSRKSRDGKPACTMAMWRANSALRTQLDGGDPAPVAGPHRAVVTDIVQAMQSETGVDITGLGHFAAVRARGKPRLIFHAAPELNDEVNR